MEDNTYKSLSEVYDIINHLDEKTYKKIPQSLVNFIKENRDKNYDVNINYEKSLMCQNLLNETSVILALIYRDYICDEQTKNMLKFEDDKQLSEIKKEFEFSWNKVRNKFKNEEPKIQTSQGLINIEKNIWYKKIYRFIISIFTRKG